MFQIPLDMPGSASSPAQFYRSVTSGASRRPYHQVLHHFLMQDLRSCEQSRFTQSPAYLLERRQRRISISGAALRNVPVEAHRDRHRERDLDVKSGDTVAGPGGCASTRRLLRGASRRRTKARCRGRRCRRRRASSVVGSTTTTLTGEHHSGPRRVHDREDSSGFV